MIAALLWCEVLLPEEGDHVIWITVCFKAFLSHKIDFGSI